MKIAGRVIALLLLVLCARTAPMDYSQSAVLWTQKSAESHALRLQAFELARLQLDAALALERPDARPPALVVDIDETVLDNSPYQAYIIINETAYPDGWKEWCEARSARALPGAHEFLNWAAGRGVDVYYISNRKLNVLDATIDNLIAAGFPDADREHVLLRDKDSGKETRRQQVLANHDILLLMGDNLSDFSDLFDKQDCAARNSAVGQLAGEWGKRFILLPNPMYGDWEAATYDHNWSRSAEEKEALRKAALEGWNPEDE